MKTFLLVDDHKIVISGLKMLLNQEFINCNIDVAKSSDDALAIFFKEKYDLVILDIGLVGEDSSSLLYNMKMRDPEVKVLIFSMKDENSYAKRYFGYGAKGFVSKEAEDVEIIKAINTVLKGNIYLSSSFLHKIATTVANNKDGNPFSTLSTREMEITLLLIKGLSVGEISKKIFLHTSTVGTHKAKIYEKTGVNNNVELSHLAELHGLN
jgi:two-component system invasion response regulator UvrY